MVPESSKPGRMYGLVKDHYCVDHHCKSEVRKLPCFMEDNTPYFLRDIEEFSSKCRHSDHAIHPVNNSGF